MVKTLETYSPFKFLAAYEAEDRTEFFGRDLEIAELYQRVYESDLVLLYGTSGTGKTSLINCGLANEFDSTDWLPIYVYRDARALKRSLFAAVDAEAEKIGKDFSDKPNISDQLRILSRLHFKPIYLIFDQFEELFILGSQEEQVDFFETLAEILDSNASVKILISMREEYLGKLYPFEAILPNLFNRRLRIETMSPLQAADVILQSCERFNIVLEEPEKNASRILQQVQIGSGTEISLPYLQVYLDQFYREDLARTYPRQIPDTPYPPLEFTSKEIESFGQISDILQNFLGEQEKNIQAELKRLHPSISPNAVKKVLGQFVSLEGTKIPLRKEGFKVAPLTDEQLQFVVEKLEESRILRSSDKVLALIHDSLAARIAGSRDAEEIAVIRNVELVKNRYKEFGRTHTWLSARELSLVENYETILREEVRLSEEEWEFIAASKFELNRKRRNRFLLIGGIFIVLLGFLLFAFWQWQTAEVAKDRAQSALLDSYLDRQETLHLKLDKTRNTIEVMKRAGEEQIMEKFMNQKLGFESDSVKLSLRIADLATELKSYHELELEEARQAQEKLQSRNSGAAQAPNRFNPEIDSLTLYLQNLEKKISLSHEIDE